MNSNLEAIMLLSNEQLDEQIKLLTHTKDSNIFSPTTDFLVANKLIQKENIIVKQNEKNLFCVPVFEYHGKTYGILESSSYLRTAMMYYLAKKVGVIKED